MDNSIIKIEHVSMKFNLGIDKGFSFKQFFVDLLSGKRRKKKKQNSIFNWGTVGVLCQPPDTLVKGGWC